MSSNADLARIAGAKRFLKQDYEKQMVQDAGAASGDYGDAGPPYWNRASWEAFKRQYGEYPYSAWSPPPSFENCPDWAYELMGLRKPPVTVIPPPA